MNTQTGVAKPVFTINKVGASDTLSLTFSNDIVIKTNSVDRMVIYTDTVGFPFIDKTTSSTGYALSMYETNRWIELKPTVSNVGVGSVTVTINNMVNMPYVMSGGVRFYLKVWVDGNDHKLFTF